jgi:protoporphyrinogen/coproporphyrinogen III oxidase
MTAPRIVVAGGGITGLAAAFTIQQEAAHAGTPIDLVVLEAGSEAGGHARTIVEDGFIVERGPDGFLDRGTETLALIDELNLRARLVPANPIRNRYILSGGALRRVPSSPPALLASDAISWGGKLRMLREPWAAAPPCDKDETVFEFAERRLGREAAETFVDTAVVGISGGDSRAISVASQFPLLKEMEREHGSLLKAAIARRKIPRPRLMSFDRGVGTVTGELASKLKGALRVNTPIDRIEKTSDGWRVRITGGAPLDADHVVLALPSHAASRLTASFDRELSKPLAAIPYVDFAVVALAYRASEVARPLDGTGYLVARTEDLSTLGVLWESSLFPHRAPAGMVLLRAILGGARRPEVSAFDDPSVAELAASEAAGVLGISAKPLRQWVCRFPSAIAQYTVGHQSRRSEIKRLVAAHPGLHVCGTAYDGVAFNDAIASARRTARTVAQQLAVPVPAGAQA